MAESMDVKKLRLGMLFFYLLVTGFFVATWGLYALVLYDGSGFWPLATFSMASLFIYSGSKKYGLTLREALIIDPVTLQGAKLVLSPGDYEYRIIEDALGSTGSTRYIVLVRPEGKHGFTLVKEAYLVREYACDLQGELLDLQIASPAAARKVVHRIQKKYREAMSDLRTVESREKAVEEYRELFLS
jgi:hypothetical protein